MKLVDRWLVEWISFIKDDFKLLSLMIDITV